MFCAPTQERSGRKRISVSDGSYGAERVWRALQRADYRIGRCTVERLMATASMHGVVRGTQRFTTIADAGADRPADLVCMPRARACEWLYVDLDDDLAPFYVKACGFRPDAGRT